MTPKIVANIRLIIGDGDSQVLVIVIGASQQGDHELGAWRRVVADAICPPWASTILRAIAMPRPVPLVFVVKNGSKTLCRASGVRPGPLSRTVLRRAGSSVQLCVAARNLDHDRIAARRQRILQQIAKYLHHPKTVGNNVQIGVHRIVSTSFASRPRRDVLEQSPGFAPNRIDVAWRSLKLNRRGKAANLVEQAQQVVLCFLQSAHKPLGLVVVLQFRVRAFRCTIGCAAARCGFRGRCR